MTIPFEDKFHVYVSLPSNTETPYYFPPVIDSIGDEFAESISFSAVEPVLNNYHNIRMTFYISKDFDLSNLSDLSTGVKKIVSDKTGFIAKAVIEQEI